MPQSDVLIVGAGPAGAWSAYQLVRAGARVRIFDASHPREKPCGGGLTGRTLAIVADAIPADRLNGIAATSLRFENGALFSEFPLPAFGLTPRSSLVIVDRRTFDAALLQAAIAHGAEHVAERVADIRVGIDGVEVQTGSRSWRGRVLIGADGANSLVRRRTCTPFSRRQISLATGYFLHGVRSSQVRVCCVAQPAGYLWSFPRPTHLAVGICAQADQSNVHALRRLALDWIREHDLDAGARAEPYSWPIPSLSSADFAREHPAGERWLLAGDAAGLVDPLTREGIYFALVSAEMAAHAISGGRPHERYAARLRDEVFPELARAGDLKARFFTSGFSELMIRGFNRSAAIRDVMVDLVAGRQPYGTLKRRLLRTFEVGLAWRLLRLQIGGRLARQRSPVHAERTAPTPES